MNPAQKLHNAARHYCIDRHAYWCAEYQKLRDRGEGDSGGDYGDKAYDTFPRYQVLAAILADIETMDPEGLPPESEVRELLILAGHTAESLFTKGRHSEIQAAAMAQEREEFVKVVRGFKPDGLDRFHPLPYRRVLSTDEVAALWVRVKPRWGADGSYYYPLAKQAAPDLHAFDTHAFNERFPPDALRQIVQSRGISRIYELREHGEDNYSLSVDLWEPYYNFAEGFWFSDALDWIMYCSHESSTTVGGVLAETVLSSWEEARNHKWSLAH